MNGLRVCMLLCVCVRMCVLVCTCVTCVVEKRGNQGFCTYTTAISH